MENQTTEMTQVLVNTYPANVQAKIDELKEQNYHDEDMFDFINVYGNDNFIQFYEEYVNYGEDYSYDAVDAFVDEFGIDCISNFCDAYYGQYDSEEQFAEQFVSEQFAEQFVSDCYPINLNDTPIVVDWTKTWECNLYYDFAFNDGFVFTKNF